MWIDPTNATGWRSRTTTACQLLDQPRHDAGITFSCRSRRCTTSPSTIGSRTTSTATGRTGPSYSRTEQQPDRGQARSLAGPIPRGMWHSVAGGESGLGDSRSGGPRTSSGRPGPASAASAESSSASTCARGKRAKSKSGRRRRWAHRRPTVKYRFNWTFPLAISPHDHNTIYAGSQHVHRTTNGGQTWQVISPDLTTERQSRAAVVRRPHARQHRRRVRGRRVRDRRVAAREGRHLGGNERRPGAGHARRREDAGRTSPRISPACRRGAR